MQVSFAEICFFCPDMGLSRLSADQLRQLTVIIGRLQQSFEFCVSEVFLRPHVVQDDPFPTSNFWYGGNQKLTSITLSSNQVGSIEAWTSASELEHKIYKVNCLLLPIIMTME